jgi:hypothetical protein
MSGTVLILGPQRPHPNLARVLDARAVPGPLAVVSAGWRHDEAELGALQEDVGRAVVHLPLYTWFEEVLAAAPDLAEAYRERQDRIKAFKKLIRTRLSSAYGVILKLHAQRVEDDDLHQAELLDAVRAVRDLDRRALEGCDAIRQEAGLAAAPWTHPAVAPLHARIRDALQDTGALCIAGGHVAVLLNRMCFFGMRELVTRHHRAGGTVVAWSAGAMVLTERVVLFYDDPPEGPSEPEVLDRGFGLIEDRTLFPHARIRLRLDQADRLRLLQARFGACTGLENGAALAVHDGTWTELGTPGSVLDLSPRAGVA